MPFLHFLFLVAFLQPSLAQEEWGRLLEEDMEFFVQSMSLSMAPTSAPITTRPPTLTRPPIMTIAPTNTNPTPMTPPPPPPNTSNQTWNRIGRFQPQFQAQVGHSVAISDDGSVIAYGVPNDAPGYAAVFRETDSDWSQVGSEIVGTVGVDDRFGSSLALSGDGETLVVGSGYSDGDNGAVINGRASVYRWIDGAWRRLGPEFVGEAPCRSLGWSVDIDRAGNRIGISTAATSGSGDFRCQGVDPGVGRVQIFDWTGSQWVQVGQNLEGTVSNYGVSITMSKDGQRVAVHAPNQVFDGIDPSTTQVFEYNQATATWTPMGSTIPTELVEFYTRGIFLSADGSRIAIASKRFADGTAFVRVLEWNGSDWQRLGPDVQDTNGCCSYFTFENSVSLSDDGSRLFFGNQGAFLFRGVVRVYDWQSSTNEWVQVGDSIEDTSGRSGEIWLGYAVDSSADGSRFIAGAPFADYVEIYEWK